MLLPLLTTVYNAAMNLGVQISVWMLPITFGCVARSRSGAYSKYMFSFLRNLCSVSHCSTLSFRAVANICQGDAYLGKNHAHVAQGQATAACITEAELLPSLSPGSRPGSGLRDALAICLRPSSI